MTTFKNYNITTTKAPVRGAAIQPFAQPIPAKGPAPRPSYCAEYAGRFRALAHVIEARMNTNGGEFCQIDEWSDECGNLFISFVFDDMNEHTTKHALSLEIHVPIEITGEGALERGRELYQMQDSVEAYWEYLTRRLYDEEGVDARGDLFAAEWRNDARGVLTEEIDSVGYDRETETLRFRLKDGKRFELDAPLDEIKGFLLHDYPGPIVNSPEALHYQPALRAFAYTQIKNWNIVKTAEQNG